jgi:GcrA cell cycle regulator
MAARWSDDAADALKRLWRDGRSASEIADLMGEGVTRNMVIGKAHRLGLEARPSPIKRPE